MLQLPCVQIRWQPSLPGKHRVLIGQLTTITYQTFPNQKRFERRKMTDLQCVVCSSFLEPRKACTLAGRMRAVFLWATGRIPYLHG